MKNKILYGAIIINSINNEIAWFVVDRKYRGMGIGEILLKKSLEDLDSKKDIFVQTFASDINEGFSARKLYEKYGFKDEKNSGKNPAGKPTVIMKLASQ